MSSDIDAQSVIQKLISYFREKTHNHDFEIRQMYCHIPDRKNDVLLARQYFCKSCGYQEKPSLLVMCTKTQFDESQRTTALDVLKEWEKGHAE